MELKHEAKPVMSDAGGEGAESAESAAKPAEIPATGLAYPVYANDSGYLVSTSCGIMDEWFRFSELASAGLSLGLLLPCTRRAPLKILIGEMFLCSHII